MASASSPAMPARRTVTGNDLARGWPNVPKPLLEKFENGGLPVRAGDGNRNRMTSLEV
jgi:hypothetical protein